jgi:methylated-DNA-[protein]-cysteine S-methyltransferase
MQWAGVPSRMGELGVAVDAAGVCAVRFGGPPPSRAATDEVWAGPARPHRHRSSQTRAPGLLAVAVAQLNEYLDGERRDFALPLTVVGGTEFERAVWEQIAGIGYGETRTYGSIATALGDPGAARAVGTACNHNPLPIVVPCHRVVGAGGKLVGFGGGLHRKIFLLELEARVTVEATFG